MKKVIGLLLALAFTFSLGGCSPESSEGSGNPQGQETSATEEPGPSAGNAAEETTPPQQDGESNILIAYFSWADNAVLDGEVDVVASPSVTIARPCPASWPAGYRRRPAARSVLHPGGGALLQRLGRLSGDGPTGSGRRTPGRSPTEPAWRTGPAAYDTVFLGYPRNWWYGAPMALLSFLGGERPVRQAGRTRSDSHGTGGLAGQRGGHSRQLLPASAQLSLRRSLTSTRRRHPPPARRCWTRLDRLGYERSMASCAHGSAGHGRSIEQSVPRPSWVPKR